MDSRISASGQLVGIPRRLFGWTRAHPVLSVFLLALAVRTVVAAAIFLLEGGLLFSDDAGYVETARLLLAGGSAGEAATRQIAMFMYPLVGALWISGDVVFGAQVLVVMVGALVSALTTGLGLRGGLSPVVAMLSGLVVALMPSQVLWSSLVLKDPFVWLAVGVVCAGMALNPHRGNSTGLALVVGGIFALGFLRGQSAIVASIAVLIALGGAAGEGRRRLVAAGVVVGSLLIAPWLGGYGPAGWSVVEAGGNVAEYRAEVSARADTAVVDPSDPAEGLGLGHLPRGISVYLLEPYPWVQASSSRLEPARWENLVWYVVLALAAVGAASELRNRRWTLFPVLYAAGITLVYALAEGSLGNAYRHRGEVVWITALLAGFGLDGLRTGVLGSRLRLGRGS